MAAPIQQMPSYTAAPMTFTESQIDAQIDELLAALEPGSNSAGIGDGSGAQQQQPDSVGAGSSAWSAGQQQQPTTAAASSGSASSWHTWSEDSSDGGHWRRHSWRTGADGGSNTKARTRKREWLPDDHPLVVARKKAAAARKKS